MLAIALLVEAAVPTGSPLDAYQQCVFRATLGRTLGEQLPDLKGREIARLVKEAATASCGAELQTIKQMFPQDWSEAADVLDATNIGVLATNAVQLVPTSVCATRLRAHGQCLK